MMFTTTGAESFIMSRILNRNARWGTQQTAGRDVTKNISRLISYWTISTTIFNKSCKNINNTVSSLQCWWNCIVLDQSSSWSKETLLDCKINNDGPLSGTPKFKLLVVGKSSKARAVRGFQIIPLHIRNGKYGAFH